MFNKTAINGDLYNIKSNKRYDPPLNALTGVIDHYVNNGDYSKESVLMVSGDSIRHYAIQFNMNYKLE